MCWRDQFIPLSDIFSHSKPTRASLIVKDSLRRREIEKEYETMPLEELEDVIATYANQDSLSYNEFYRFSRAKDILLGRLFPF